MILRVLIYNLFLLFRYEFLGKKEKRKRLKTLRYKYFAVPAQMGRDAILRISAQNRKVLSRLSFLFTRIGLYVPRNGINCRAFGYT